VKKYPELHRREFEQFLERFCMPGSLKFRNNKWIGLARGGKPFTVHVKHGATRSYPPRLVEAVLEIYVLPLRNSPNGTKRGECVL
jgi:hypothetical protein